VFFVLYEIPPRVEKSYPHSIFYLIISDVGVEMCKAISALDAVVLSAYLLD
jgi:hypothetical protein